MRKKFFTGLLCVLLMSCLLCGTFCFAEEAADDGPGEATAQTPDAASGEWTAVIDGKYTVDENGNVVSAEHYGQIGPGYDGVINTVLYNGFETGEDFTTDYTVRVKMTGNKELPLTSHVRQGIIPWYVDKDNYLVVYVEWADWDRPSEMRCVQVTGRIGGENLYVMDWNAFTYLQGSGWNDFWTDGYAMAPSETYELVVEVYEQDDGIELIFVLNDASGNWLKDGSVWVQKSEQTKQSGKVGLYAMSHEVTFSDFSVTPIEEEPDPTEPNPTDPEPTEPQPTQPEETEPKGTQPQATQPGDQQNAAPTSVGLIIGIVAAVVVVGVVVIILLKKKK